MYLTGIPINSEIEALVIKRNAQVISIKTCVDKIIDAQVPSIAVELYENGKLLKEENISDISIVYRSGLTNESVQWGDVAFRYDEKLLEYIVGSRYESQVVDRRSSYRVPCGEVAQVALTTNSVYVDCKVYDMSKTGISFVTDSSIDFQIGDNLKIKFYDYVTKSTIKLQCTVVNKYSINNYSMFRYGCSFTLDFPEFIQTSYRQRKLNEIRTLRRD